MKNILCVILLLFLSLSIKAQHEISFTNKVSFTKSGYMNGVRLIVLLPAPVTNEYQEITSLQTNCGQIFDVNATNKVLHYDGSFDNQTIDVYESFKYKSKAIKIDFNNKSEKNIVTNVDPNEYLGSDGKYIDTDNKTIQQIGNKLWDKSSNKLDYAKRCYEYVAANYEYINGSFRSLAKILQEGGGECGDFSTLFVNLLRYKGIPARHNIGIWINGGYHVWPDFYHEDYGWIPVDPTFKNSNPDKDYFGRYDGNLIIVSQGLTSFEHKDVSVKNVPLQTFYYWYWYTNGSGNITGKHTTSKDYQVDGIHGAEIDDKKAITIYNLQGIKQTGLRQGINIVNGKKVFLK